MAELRGDSAHSSLWSGYNNPVSMSGRLGGAFDSGLPNPSTAPPQATRPRNDHNDIDQHASLSYTRFPQDETAAYDGHAHPDLASQQAYPNLKRSFSQTEGAAYQEMVSDIREDGSRVNVNHDHKLLAFRKAQDKHTITDQHGRMQQLEMSAQLHGMFFLSEMPANASEGNNQQPELTCYRRNLFQISGSLITPRGQLNAMTDAGESLPVSNMEVTVSAIESVDGNPVRLIVIPWKTPPPNSPEVAQNPDQEPPPLPLIPFQDDVNDGGDGELAAYPIGWRRLQFRIATANNGRRKELQQHFVLHLKVFGTLSNGSKIVLTESTTAPIVVRGRSPRNFQARKEIPLLGSSAGSRGQALVETGVGVIAGPLGVKSQDAKARGIDMQVPRSAFTFSPPKVPASQMASVRPSSFPAWSPSNHPSISQLPSSTGTNYPAATLPADPYSGVPLPGPSNFNAEPQDVGVRGSLPQGMHLSLGSSEQAVRSQFPYVQSGAATRPMPANPGTLSSDPSLNVPRYVDSSRPAKGARRTGHQSVPSNSSVTNDTSPEYRYGTYPPVGNNPTDGAQQAPPRDYYPSSSGWTTTAGEPSATVAYSAGDGRSYSFPQENYRGGQATGVPGKPESAQPGAPTVYNGGPRGSFEAMNNYSWGGS